MSNNTESGATVIAMADRMRGYAELFVQRDWNYTRDHDIKHIRYADDYRDYDHPLRRLRRTLAKFIPRWDNTSQMVGMGRFWGWQHPLITLRVGLRTESHQPDGVLDNGGIIVHWEETGEYLQYVQPSVGSLLADWMEAEPDSPHAQRIAAEMKRIDDAYADRLRADGDLVTYEVVR